MCKDLNFKSPMCKDLKFKSPMCNESKSISPTYKNQNLNLPRAKISSDLSHRKDGRVMLKCSGSGVNSEKNHLQLMPVCTYSCTCSQYRSTSSICTEGWRFPQSVKATHAIGLLTPKYSWAQVNHAEPNKLRKESTNTNINANTARHTVIILDQTSSGKGIYPIYRQLQKCTQVFSEVNFRSIAALFLRA